MTQQGPPSSKLGWFALACVIAVPAMFIGPGIWLIWQREFGTHVQATVTDCHEQLVGKAYAEYCNATWTVNGHVIVGDIEGSDGSHVGTTIAATVRGDTAYSESLTLPLLLIGLGLPFAGLGLRMWFVKNRAIQLPAAYLPPAT